jgi:heme/copper-type cytochrome/quinol oxidase subunit 2
MVAAGIIDPTKVVLSALAAVTSRFADGCDPTRIFTTANEIHIPTGKPVRIELDSADVIHSFWVPVLTGKMDVIPGQRNLTWIEAQNPGIYRDQCVEAVLSHSGIMHRGLWLV